MPTRNLAALPQPGAGEPPPGGYQVSPDWGIFTNLVAAARWVDTHLRDPVGRMNFRNATLRIQS